MELFYSQTSPYTRRVCAALILLGLDKTVNLTPVSPFDAPKELTDVNPLSQIPTLRLDNGEMLCGSALIVEYLNSQAAGTTLLPESNDRWQMKNLAGIAEGIVDAALSVVLEGRRPANQQSSDKVGTQEAKIIRSLKYLSQIDNNLDEEIINFYTLTLGIALGYLDFRLPNLNWRDEAPSLSAWYQAVHNQAWLIETRPPA